MWKEFFSSSVFKHVMSVAVVMAFVTWAVDKYFGINIKATHGQFAAVAHDGALLVAGAGLWWAKNK